MGKHRLQISWRSTVSLFLTVLVTAGIGTYLYGFGKADNINGQYYGMNWHPIWVSPSVQNTEMDLMQQAGIKSVRIDVEWYFVEPSKGTYNTTYMSRLDNAVNGLTARGMQPLLIVSSTPKWVTGAPAGDPAPNAEPPLRSTIGDACNQQQTNCTPYNGVQDYDNFLSYVMHHFGSKVSQYEIYNEPTGYWSWRNTYSDWVQDSTTRAIDYTTLLKSAYATAKAINPNVTILGASLSGTDGPRQIFLKTMYAQGARAYFDVLSQHYYCDPPSENWCNADRTKINPELPAANYKNSIYSIMLANGDSAKPVWLTETGYNTYTVGGAVNETQQADFLIRSYNTAKTEPNIARVYWYTFDSPDTGTSTQNYYGIVEANTYNTTSLSPYRLKPAYQALKTLVLSTTPTTTTNQTPRATTVSPHTIAPPVAPAKSSSGQTSVTATNSATSTITDSDSPSAATPSGSSSFKRTTGSTGIIRLQIIAKTRLIATIDGTSGTIIYRVDGKALAADTVDLTSLADGQHVIQATIMRAGMTTKTIRQTFVVNTRKPAWKNVYLRHKQTTLTTTGGVIILIIGTIAYTSLRMTRSWRRKMTAHEQPDASSNTLADYDESGNIIKPDKRDK